MAFCGQCGFENPDGARFCGSCGADLTLQVVEDTPEPVVEEAPQVPVVPTAPATPTIPEQPQIQVAPETPVAPVIQEAPATPEPPQAQVAPAAPETPAAPVAPTPPKKGGKKVLIGCGIAAAIGLLLAIGGGIWGYNYLSKQNPELNVKSWFDEGGGDTDGEEDNGTNVTEVKDDGNNSSEEFGTSNDSTSLNDEGDDWGMSEEKGEETGKDGDKGKETGKDDDKGKEEVTDKQRPTIDEKPTQKSSAESQSLAKKLNVPVVNYNALPMHDRYFSDKSGELGAKCTVSQKGGRTTVITMELNQWTTGEKLKFTLTSCGGSIYKLTNTKDNSLRGYVFVYQGGKRFLMGDENSMLEFNMN